MATMTTTSSIFALCQLLDVVDEAIAAVELADLATAALGRQVDPAPVTVSAVPYAFGSPATAALLRVSGADRDARPWTLFCKVLHHVRHWPQLALMPPQFAAQFVAEFPWRSELDAWRPEFRDRLPPGLRLPRLHRVVDLGDDRLAVWMEHIDDTPDAWDLDRFARAARLLGRFGARSASTEVVTACALPPGFALRMYAERSVPFRELAPLADDRLWAHPWLVEHADLRRRIRRLGYQIPGLLDRLDTLPQSMPHGDASPQNLLVSASDPDTFVMIDISFQSPHALGFDLGQLLVGLVHADLMPAGELGAVAEVILPAYACGVTEEGVTVSPASLELGFLGSLLLRSGFDSMRYDLLGSEDPPAADTFANRLALTHFVVERAEAALAR